MEEVEVEEGVALVEVEVEDSTVEVDEGVVDVDVEVDVEVGATLLDGMLDEVVGSSTSDSVEGEGDGAAVVGAGEDVVGAAAEVAVYQYLPSNTKGKERTRRSGARRRSLSCGCCRCRYLWGLWLGDRPSIGRFWSCHCSSCWYWNCIDGFQESCQRINGSRCGHVYIEYVLFVVDGNAIERRIDQLVYLHSDRGAYQINREQGW